FLRALAQDHHAVRHQLDRGYPRHHLHAAGIADGHPDGGDLLRAAPVSHPLAAGQGDAGDERQRRSGAGLGHQHGAGGARYLDHRGRASLRGRHHAGARRVADPRSRLQYRAADLCGGDRRRPRADLRRHRRRLSHRLCGNPGGIRLVGDAEAAAALHSVPDQFRAGAGPHRIQADRCLRHPRHRAAGAPDRYLQGGLDMRSHVTRALGLYAGLVVLIIAVSIASGVPYTARLLAEAAAYSLIALGLNIQWGYGGLFNFGIMGFLMVGGASVTFISYPINPKFWNSDGPMLLGHALLAAIFGALLIIAARNVHRIGIKGGWKTTLVVIAWSIAYVVFRSQIDPATIYIEKQAGFVGGLGLNPVLGWAFGGFMVAIIAYVIGRICLGLRTDYLAIATIGISEII